MSYHIEAHLNGRNPRLEVHDADSGAVRLLWEYPKADPDSAAAQLAREAAIDELFHELFLLTTEEHLRKRRRQAGAAPRHDERPGRYFSATR